MLKLCKVTEAKVLFPFFQFNFNSFKSVAAILEKGLLSSVGVRSTIHARRCAWWKKPESETCDPMIYTIYTSIKFRFYQF